VLAQAEMIGCADRLLRETIAYARQRIQFGKPIAEYQAVRHRLADMLRDVEMSRTALVWAVNSPVDAARAAAITLGWCEAVADGAIQLHGGYGFTWEAGLHFVRRHLSCLGEIMTSVGGHRWPA
jgi:alkylation response protein AidB-like acyl-CoA dehydrogenase